MYNLKSILLAAGAFATLSGASPVLKARQDSDSTTSTADASAQASAAAAALSVVASSDVAAASSASSASAAAASSSSSSTDDSATSITLSIASSPNEVSISTTVPASTVTWAQPSVVGSVIPFGDFNPSAFIATKLVSICSSGCPESGTITGNYVATPTSTAAGSPTGAGATGSYPAGGSYADTDSVTIVYTITTDIVNDADIPEYLAALAAMIGASDPPNTFTYTEPTTSEAPILLEKYTTTQYNGFNQVGMSTFVNFTSDDNGKVSTTTTSQYSLSISFSGKLAGSDVSCGTIEGPISSLLGLIPDVGTVLGIIGSTACSAASAQS